ncbi:MAG: MFS transporter, partial [Desulfobacterales bacterium]
PHTEGPAPDAAAESLRGRLGALALLTLLFFLNFLARIIQAPLLPAIEQDLRISHAQAGSLFFFLAAGYFLSLLGSGFVSARIGHRRTMILSAAATGLALGVTAASNSLSGLRLGQFLVGAASGLYLPSAIATITGFVPPRHWGKAIAIHEVAPNAAFVLAPVLAEALLSALSWKGGLAALGAGSVLGGIVFLVGGRVGGSAGEAPSFGPLRELAGSRNYWLMVLLFGLGIGGSMGLYTMLPLFLVSGHGFDRIWANGLISFSRLPGVFAAFGSGWLTDRFGPGRTMALVLFANGGLTVALGLAPAAGVPYLVAIQPALAVCFFPAGFAAIALTAPPAARNIAVSLVTPFAFLLGAGALPTLIGALSEAVSFAAGFAAAGLLIGFGALLPRRLRFR